MQARTNLLLNVGIFFYSTGVVAIGLLHFIFPGFRPIMIPIPASATDGIQFIPKLVGFVLIVLGITTGFKNPLSKSAAVWLSIIFCAFFLLGHLPLRIRNHPDILAYWTDALKMLTMVGGALMISNFRDGTIRPALLQKLIPYSIYGQHMFALMLMIFGIDHVLYNEAISTIVPQWLFAPRFWTYFTGAVLFFAGACIVLNVRKAAISFVLACMIFSWLFLVHLRLIDLHKPSLAAELAGAITCLIFAGIALIVHIIGKEQQAENTRY